MKTLRFRFWHDEEKKMYPVMGLFVDYVLCIKKANVVIFQKEAGKTMQFIGRTDMNGTDIYEDDIVRMHKENGALAQIIKVGHLFGMKDEEGYWRDIPVKGQGKMEVIGNAFESPDLLEYGI